MHRHRLASVLGFALVLALTAFFAPLVRGADDKPKDSAKSEALKEGTPDLKSAGPLAFGPSGILFVADPVGAAVFAIDVGEADSSAPVKDLSVEQIDVKVSALLGTSPKEIEIRDLAVQPGSGKAYLSVMRGQGPDAAAVIVRVASPTDIRAVSLDKVRFAKASLPDAPADAGAGAGGGDGGKGRRGQNQRLESITDLAYIEGRLLIAGLSNEEFASTLRSIPYPFREVQKGTGVEIYHGAHGQLETRSPVRTFVPFQIGGEPHLFAAYTCTPLVTFPLSKLAPGSHLKGKTVAELGNQNRPLDMIVYKKDGKDYLLIANSARGVMKVSTENVEKTDAITDPVRGGGTKGLPYDTMKDWNGILQLDRLDASRALVVRRLDAGSLQLETRALP
jgi:hypothetical protein